MEIQAVALVLGSTQSQHQELLVVMVAMEFQAAVVVGLMEQALQQIQVAMVGQV
jgi:hypothetical protein